MVANFCCSNDEPVPKGHPRNLRVHETREVRRTKLPFDQRFGSVLPQLQTGNPDAHHRALDKIINVAPF
jgi:hypothetical protein